MGETGRLGPVAALAIALFTAPSASAESADTASEHVDRADRACAEADVAKLARGLEGWLREHRRSEAALRVALGCADPRVVCLDRFGRLAGDELPASVRVGQRLVVHVLVPAADSADFVLSVSTDAAIAQNALRAVETRAPDGAPADDACRLSAAQRTAVRSALRGIERAAGRAWAPGAEDALADDEILTKSRSWLDPRRRPRPEFVSLETSLVVPQGDAVSIDFRRVERGIGAATTEARHSVPVDNGRYYLEFAVAASFVYRGARDVVLAPTAPGDALRVGIEEDWHVTAAAMLQVFPAGRQRGQTTSFRRCRSRSCVENWLGVGVGTGIDHLLVDWYFGFVLEPLSGIGFGLGASLLRGQFLPKGRAEGMLLPLTGDVTPRSAYMWRPFFAITLTPDIFGTIDRAVSANSHGH
jgi:hypothetical protein